MCTYEFYWFNKTEKVHCFRLQQENRTSALRITSESVLNLGMKVAAADADISEMYFIRVDT